MLALTIKKARIDCDTLIKLILINDTIRIRPRKAACSAKFLVVPKAFRQMPEQVYANSLYENYSKFYERPN